MESTTVYIYGLWDPRTLELRYIGKSCNPEERLGEHIVMSRGRKGQGYNHNPPKEKWIRELLSEQLKPALDILEECTEEAWKEAEKAWIKAAREAGARLTNITEGGDGFPSGKNHPQYGRKISDELKRKLSESLKGKTSHIVSESARKKLREANLGKNHSSETKLKMTIAQQGEKNHFYGKKHSEETRAKMRKPRGKMSKEHIEKLSRIRTGRICSDSAKLKASLSHYMVWAKRRGDTQKIYELQNQYLQLFGEYNKKYPIP